MFCVQNVGALQTLNPAWIYQGPAGSWTPTTHIILLSIGARRETHFNPAAVVILQLSGLQDDGWMCSSLYVMLVLIIYVTFQEGSVLILQMHSLFYHLILTMSGHVTQWSLFKKTVSSSDTMFEFT